jgi:uncharacterized protein (TIGR00106 family)
MMMMEFSVTPLDQGASISPYVARCVDLVDRSGLAYQLTPMGTVVEGQLDQLLGVLQQCVDALAADCERVTCAMKLDYRRGADSRLQSKIQSIEERLGRAVQR